MSKIDSDDLTLWNEFVRDIKPYKRRRIASPDSKPTLKKQMPSIRSKEHILLHVSNLVNFDSTQHPSHKKTRIELRRLKIDATIDLHGYTIDDARSKLLSFLARNQREETKNILVITGKGAKSAERTIRTELSRWMTEPSFAAIISGYQSAKPEHGGGGAFYVYLRKRSDAAIHS